MLNGLDLFSGIGGLSVALEPWVRPFAYCEIDRYCQAQLLSRMSKHAIPFAPVWDDVRTLTRGELNTGPGEIEIIYGGFPCQDISVAGDGGGLEGKRSGLFFEVARLVQEIEPAFVFLENVPAIRTRGSERVGKELSRLGYDCRWDVVSAAEVGACHIRKRWFLLAHANRIRIREQSGWIEGAVRTEARKPLSSFEALDYHSLCNGRIEGRPWPEIWGRLGNAFFDGNQPWPEEIPEPAVCGVPNGIPFRVDRLRGLGNAVVPLQAREAFKRLIGL